MYFFKKYRLLFSLGLLVFFSILLWGHTSFNTAPKSDGEYYNQIALNLIEKHRFIYEIDNAVIEPAYPVFISFIYLIFDRNSYDMVRIAQILLLFFSTLFVYLIAKRIFDEKTATLTSLAVAIFYGFAISAVKFNREILILFFIVLLVYFLTESFFRRNGKWFFSSGVIVGILALSDVITQFLIIPLLVLLLLLLFKKTSFMRAVFLCFLMFVGFSMIAGSWSLANNVLMDTYSLTPRDGDALFARVSIMERVSENYFAYFVGHTFGYYFTDIFYPETDLLAYRDFSGVINRKLELAGEGYSAAEANGIMRREGLEKIANQPYKYFAMTVLDFIAFNNPIIPYKYENGLWGNSRIYMTFVGSGHKGLDGLIKTFAILLIRAAWFMFFLLAFYGFVKKRLAWRKFAVILLIIFYFNLTYSMVHAIPRYALPIYPLYIMFFVVGFIALIDKLPLFSKLSNNILSKLNPAIK